MTKKLRNIILGVCFFLGAGANSAKKDSNFEFNLSGLKPWQAELFIKAGRKSWGVKVKRNNLSKNRAYLVKKPEAKAMFARFYINAHKGEINYKIAFRDEVNWADCSKPNSEGWNFYRFAEHEWGHILGYEHTINPFSVMYSSENDPFYKFYPEFDFCKN